MKKLLVTAIALTFSAASFGMNVGCEYHTFRSRSSYVDMTMVHTSICKGKIIGYYPNQRIALTYYGNPNTPNLKPFSGDLVVFQGSPFNIAMDFDYKFKGRTAYRDVLCTASIQNTSFFIMNCSVQLVNYQGEIFQRDAFVVPMYPTMTAS